MESGLKSTSHSHHQERRHTRWMGRRTTSLTGSNTTYSAWNWLQPINSQQQMNNQSQSLLSQFSNHQLQQLRRAPTLEEKDQLITRFKQENAQAQEVQRQLDEVRESLERIRRPRSRFGTWPLLAINKPKLYWALVNEMLFFCISHNWRQMFIHADLFWPFEASVKSQKKRLQVSSGLWWQSSRAED